MNEVFLRSNVPPKHEERQGAVSGRLDDRELAAGRAARFRDVTYKFVEQAMDTTAARILPYSLPE